MGRKPKGNNVQQLDQNQLKLRFFKCSDCSNIYNDPSGLTDHKNAQHSQPAELPCTLCSESFKLMSNLQEHTLSKHCAKTNLSKDILSKKCTEGFRVTNGK